MNPQSKTDNTLRNNNLQENTAPLMTSHNHPTQNAPSRNISTTKQKDIVSAVIELSKLNIPDEQKANLIELFLSKTERIE